jgi:glycosyltransferase involved in cell wall biosynthesis
MIAMSPRVSIVIPCRNGAAWLGEAIESSLGQSWSNLQIIVVDNGSTDGSIDLAGRYKARGITVLECEWAGASAARNAGLKRADGDLIQFLDADDLLDADKIRRQVERLNAAPAASVASGAWTRFARDPSKATFTPEAVWRDFAPEDFLIASWLGGGMMPNFSWLTPRAVIERAGPWNETLSVYDDGEFFCRVVLASSGIVFCADARGYYRSAGALTLSKRRDGEALASAFTAVDLSCRQLLQRCASAAAAKACATHYQRFAYDAYPQAADLVAQAEKRAVELGGSDLRAGGGPAFQMLARGLGWKLSKRAQLAWRTLRGRAAAAPG